MSSMKSENTNEINSLDREIDLRSIFLILLRYKKFISFFSLLGLIIAFLSNNFSEKVWEGEFQIYPNINASYDDNYVVLQLQKDPELLIKIGNSSFLNKKGEYYKSDVQILKSSGILFDTYKYVKYKKSNLGIDVDKLSFKEWRKSIDINKIDDSELINVSYKDTNKKIVNDVLNKISSSYKSFADTKKSQKLIILENNLLNFTEPSKVLIKYSKLLNNLIENKLFNDDLDIQFKNLIIKEERNLKPWAEITKPQVFKADVGYSLKYKLVLFLLSGSILGSIFGLIIDLIKDKISNLYQLNSLLDCKVLEKLSLKDVQYWDQSFELISKFLKTNTQGNLGILVVDNTEIEAHNTLNNLFKKFLDNNRQVVFSNNIKEVLDSDNIILLITLNYSTKNTLKDLCNKLDIFNKNIYGSIVIGA